MESSWSLHFSVFFCVRTFYSKFFNITVSFIDFDNTRSISFKILHIMFLQFSLWIDMRQTSHIMKQTTIECLLNECKSWGIPKYQDLPFPQIFHITGRYTSTFDFFYAAPPTLSVASSSEPWDHFAFAKMNSLWSNESRLHEGQHDIIANGKESTSTNQTSYLSTHCLKILFHHQM